MKVDKEDSLDNKDLKEVVLKDRDIKDKESIRVDGAKILMIDREDKDNLQKVKEDTKKASKVEEDINNKKTEADMVKDKDQALFKKKGDKEIHKVIKELE